MLVNRNKQFVQTIDKLQKQVNELIEDVNSIIQIYSKRVEQYDKQIKMDPQFKKVWENMKEKKWDLITGRQIRIIYDKLKQDNFIINKQEIRMMKEKESKKVNLLLDGLNQKLSEYIKQDIVTLPQHWSKEDQQELKIYNEQIKQNPKYSNAYFQRGLFYHNRNQLQKALSDYNKAIYFDPNYSFAYCNRGLLYKNRNQLEQAQGDYNKAIECNTKYSKAYYNRALLYDDRKQFEKALSDYNKAIEYNPKYSMAYCNRGVLYYNRNELDKALIDYTKAIECTKKALYYRNRALVYRKLNIIKQAESDQKISDELSK